MPSPELFACCFIRLPARPAHLPEDRWDATLLQALPFALTDSEGEILRSGHADAGAPPAARDTVLIVDARDVLLLRVPLPAITGARLREALPGLLEERLLGNPEHSHVAVLARHENGEATLAVADRAWLAFVLGVLGNRRVRLLPAALCVPVAGDRPAVVVEAPSGDTDAGCWRLTVRASADVGYGIAIGAALA
uniref:type II secretion system protein GspL n=1 Tax=Cupriavidus sp. WS TaxID=1312922 RepID=UPI00035E998A